MIIYLQTKTRNENILLQEKKGKIRKMKLNLAQTKLVGLTMKLDLKTREYQMLCEELDKYKE